MSGPRFADGAQVPSGSVLWDEHATWWRATFTKGADPEYDEQIIPIVLRALAGRRRVLDLGCGEGQVARALVSAGGESPPAVVGLDPSIRQLESALAEGGGGLSYVRGAGEQLPFPDASFDAVFCCLSIEHADDPDAVLAEVARVLVAGGRFLLLINHPITQGPDSGFIDDQILGEHYWRIGPYLTEQVSVEEVDSGVAIPFAHRPLHRYVNPLADRDVVLVHLEEPPPLERFLAESLEPALERAIPRLMVLSFELRPRADAKGAC